MYCLPPNQSLLVETRRLLQYLRLGMIVIKQGLYEQLHHELLLLCLLNFLKILSKCLYFEDDGDLGELGRLLDILLHQSHGNLLNGRLIPKLLISKLQRLNSPPAFAFYGLRYVVELLQILLHRVMQHGAIVLPNR